MSTVDSQIVLNDLPTKSKPGILTVLKQIWKEMTLGVGFWGALRPIFAALLALLLKKPDDENQSDVEKNQNL